MKATTRMQSNTVTATEMDGFVMATEPPVGAGGSPRFAPHFPLDPGYKGMLEVVKNESRIMHVEFNEWCTPCSYIRTFQGASKRRSAFAFFQATK